MSAFGNEKNSEMPSAFSSIASNRLKKILLSGAIAAASFTGFTVISAQDANASCGFLGPQVICAVSLDTVPDTPQEIADLNVAGLWDAAGGLPSYFSNDLSLFQLIIDETVASWVDWHDIDGGNSVWLSSYSNPYSVEIRYDPVIGHADATISGYAYIWAQVTQGIASIWGAASVDVSISGSSPFEFTYTGSAFESRLLGTYQLSSATVPVPGPEAGAGIGALAMGGLAYWMHRRRREPIAA